MKNARLRCRCNWGELEFPNDQSVVVVDVAKLSPYRRTPPGCFYQESNSALTPTGFFLAGLALQCFFELPVCKNTVLNQNPWQRHYQVLIRLKVVYHQLPERDIIPLLETMKLVQLHKLKR